MIEAGYRGQLSSLLLTDIPAIERMLRMHALLRVKGELDQFSEGLKCCGVLEAIKRHPSLMAAYFTHTPLNLTAGKLCLSTVTIMLKNMNHDIVLCV